MTTPMSNASWNHMCDQVANKMKVHTRPYVTPLIEDVTGKPPHIGTGTFLDRVGTELLTCEHVAKHDPFLHQFNSNQPLLRLSATWRTDPQADVAITPISRQHWTSAADAAAPLSMSRFAARHQPVEHEILFFRGIAGENVRLYGDSNRVTMTGYCSQEKPGSGNANIFEILWDPQSTTVTSATDSEVLTHFRHDDPAGFSGSLVWNTRFVELGCNLQTWTPEDAMVTGLLRRWDTTTKTLLTWRVEHLLGWL